MWCYGVNFLVVVDASYDPNALLLVPILSQITTTGDVIGHQASGMCFFFK